MAADDDDFVWPLAPADFADDVRRVGIGKELRLHLQAEPDRRAAFCHALETFGVFGRDRGRGNLRLPVGVAKRARCAACAVQGGRPRG